MKVAVIGVGYVGLVSGTGFAEMGNDVTCVDVDKNRIDNLNKGILPIYEPGLEEMVLRNIKSKRLSFVTDIKLAVNNSDILFLAVGTPLDKDGSADLSYILTVAKEIGECIEDYRVVVVKSTVPVGTGELVRKEINAVLEKRGVKVDFDIVSNPEFLREGVAVDDFMKPDRVVIGVDSDRAKEFIERLYKPFSSNGHSMIYMDIPSSEMTKYAANAMLATKISFINEIARLCESIGADVTHVRRGIGSDHRIGNHFISPGIGYGGSCFPKDIQALLNTGKVFHHEMKIMDAVETVNKSQRIWFVTKIMDYYKGDVKGKKFAMWGMAFKPGTDDMREAPSIDMAQELMDAGAMIVAYDPVARETAKKCFAADAPLSFVDDLYQATDGVDGIILSTEWSEFKRPDFDRLKSLMKEAIIFDGRNQYEPSMLAEKNFKYISVGRKPVLDNIR